MLDSVGSMVIIIGGILLILILLRVLMIVHKQAGRVKELETRINMMDSIEAKEENSNG